jgi:cellulose synthase/poly-beta-1,6-N-acetylglucosamine synthase-like glycosyltransferase
VINWMTSILIGLGGISGLHILFAWIRAWMLGWRARRRPTVEFRLTSTPLASILIPAWKERTTLAATIDSLQQLTYPKWEAIVIAGGPDGTAEYADELCAGLPRFTVIAQPPRGKNAALNLGYARARGDVVVILDADCVVEPEWLARLVAPLTQGYAAAFADYSAADRTWVTDEFEMAKIAAYRVRDSAVLHGGGIALWRSVIEALNGFPEAVTVGTDWDLNERVTKLGVEKAFVPEAHHTTHLPATIGRYFRDEVRWRRAHLQATMRFFASTPAGIRVTAASLSFYVAGILFVAVPLAAVALMSLAPQAIYLWPLFWSWLLLRRAGLGLEVLACTHDRHWLSRVWVSSALLVVSFAAGLTALLTCRRKVVFFQGPRPQHS